MRRGTREKVLAMLLALGMVLQSPMASIGTLAAEIETSGEETLVESPEETPVEQPTETLVEQPTETLVEQPTETPVEQPKETPEEQPVTMGSAKVTVSFCDEENLAERREMEGNNLFHVYADGVKLEEQPGITLDDETPQEMYGMQTYTYTIHPLPLYKEDGVTPITYTAKQLAAKGYQSIPTEAIEAEDEKETEQVLATLATPQSSNAKGDLVTLQKTDKEEILQAEKTFGNYLPVFVVSGQIIWPDASVVKAVRPEMEAYFQTQFTILRNGEAYDKFRVEYAQDTEDANRWNYTVEGLFTTTEDGSAAEYTVQGGQVEGFVSGENQTVIKSDTKEALFRYAAPIEVAPAVSPVVPMLKASETVTVAESNGTASMQVNWLESKLTTDYAALHGTEFIQVSYKIAGGANKEAVTFSYTSSGGQMTLTKEQLTALGLTEQPTGYFTREEGTATETFKLSGLPSKISKPGTDGTPVVSEVTWEIELQKAPEGYILDAVSTDTNNKTYNLIEKTTFRGEIVIRNGSIDPKIKDIKAKLTMMADDREWSVDGFEREYGVTVALTETTAGYTVGITGIPWCDASKKEIIYAFKSTQTTIPEGKDYYETLYDNAKAPNFGTNQEECHNGGSLILILQGTTSYTGTKEWLDERDNATRTLRPDAEWELWRYSKKDGGSFKTASPVQGNDGANIIWTLNKELDTETITTTGLTSLPEGLPKYDTDGYLYVYFTRETLTNVPDGGQYEKVFGKVADGTGSEKLGAIVQGSDQLPEGVTRKSDDASLYNGGTLSNRITGNTVVKQKKAWKAAAHQNELKEVRVELTLYGKALDAGEDAWAPVGGKDNLVKQELTGFIAEFMVQEASTSQSTYDALGREMQYEWRETAVYEGTDNTNLLQGDGTFQLSHNKKDGEELKDGKEWYQSTIDPDDGTIVNQLVGETEYYVDKLWAKIGPDGQPIKDSAGKVEYGKDAPRGAAITVELLRDNKSIPEEVRLEGSEREKWTHKWEKLPKFDEGGARYTYVAEEKDEFPGWDSDYTYNLEELKVHAEANCQIKNTPEGAGKSIRVKKEWLDDGDQEHRESVTVEVWREAVNANGINAPAKAIRTVTLVAEKNWWSEVGITEYVVNGSLTDEKPEGDPNPQIFEGGSYYIREVALGNNSVYKDEETTTLVDSSVKPTSGERNYVTTDNHKYEVTYSMNGTEYIVSNRRMGRVDVTVTKNWVDGGQSKQDRLALGAKITLECVEYEDAVKDDPNGNGYVKIFAGGLEHPIYGADGTTPVGMTQALTGVDDETISFTKLPKYDGDGKVIHYTIKETSENDNLKTKEYHGTITQTGYEVGQDHAQDKQSMQVVNQRIGSKEVVFHKKWIDQYVYTQGKRPDIYLNLYKADTMNLEPIKIETHIDSKWTKPDENDPYNWDCTYKALPKYDDAGKEITYYATEGMHVDRAALDYIPEKYEYNKAEYSSVSWNETSEAYEVVHDIKANQDEVIIAEDGQVVLKEDGTFVNELRKPLVIQGKKIWANVPDGFPATELPKLKISIKQKSTTLVKDMEAWIDDITSDKFQVDFTLKYEKGNTIDGEPVTGQQSSQFLPKYEATSGELYTYEVKEDVIGITEDMKTAYEELPAIANNYLITNSYNTTQDVKSNVGTFKITKVWDGLEQKYPQKQYPDITFDVYRFYESINNPGTYSKLEKVTSKTLQGGETELKIENQFVFAPNGNPYRYYVQERNLDGYTFDVNQVGETPSSEMPKPDDSTVLATTGVITLIPEQPITKTSKLEKVISKFLSPAASKLFDTSATRATEITFTNTYTNPQQTIQVEGAKKWNDYENGYNSRPNEITLTVSRWAEKQGADNAIAEDKLFKAVDSQITMEPDVMNTNGDPTITWEKNRVSDQWTYVINNLDKYAPNGSPWKYKVVETPITEYTATTGTVTASSTEADKITMKDLVNTSYKKASFTKKWDGGNQHHLRPTSIKVKLQVKVGAGGTWADADTALQVNGQIPEQLKTAVAETEVNSTSDVWSTITFKNLPAYNRNAPYFYRFIETEVGGTKVTVQDAEADDIQYHQSGLYQPIQEVKGVEGVDKTDVTTVTNELVSTMTTSLKVVKKWEDTDNAYDTRPSEITLQLERTTDPLDANLWDTVKQADGTTPVTHTLTPNADGKWEVEYTNLPKHVDNDSNAGKYHYRAVEVNQSPIYKVASNESKDDLSTGQHVNTITNKLIPTLNVTATKTWYSQPKTDVTLELQYSADGTTWKSFTTMKEKTISVTDSWTTTWTGLPAYMGDGTTLRYYRVIEKTGLNNEYFVTYKPASAQAEIDTSNPDKADLTFAITNTEKTDFTITKKWSNVDYLREEDQPVSITYNLWRKTAGDSYPTEPENKVAEQTQLTVAKEGSTGEWFENWTAVTQKLPKYDSNGDLYIYYATEAEIQFKDNATQDVGAGGTISFAMGTKHTDATADQKGNTTSTNTLKTIDLKITKAWDTRHTELRKEPMLHVYRILGNEKEELSSNNGLPNGQVDKTGTDNWIYSWNTLPQYNKEGKEYTYLVTEEQVAGYETPVYQSKTGQAKNDGAPNEGTIQNTLTEFTLRKKAVDGPTEDLFGASNLPTSEIKLEVLNNQNEIVATWSMDTEGNVSSFLWKTPGVETSKVMMTGADVGKIVGLPAGTYTVKEVRTPNGYLTARPYNFTLKVDGSLGDGSGEDGEIQGQILTISDELIRGDVVLTKYLGQEEEGKELKGAVFALYEAGSNTLLAENLTTDASGKISIKTQTDKEFLAGPDVRKSLSIGLRKGSYYLKETAVPESAKMPENLIVPFEIDGKEADGLTNVVQPTIEKSAVNTVFKAAVEFTKVDADAPNQNGVDGAVFTLIHSDGDSKSATADSDGIVKFENLRKGSYTLKETTAPAGYALSDTPFECTFQIIEADAEQTLNLAEVLNADHKGAIIAGGADVNSIKNNVKNHRIPGTIIVHKSDEKDATSLDGAEFKLQRKTELSEAETWEKVFVTGQSYTYDKGTNSFTLDTAKPNTGDLEIKGLDWGTYTFTETKAPKGYELPAVAPSIDLTINRESVSKHIVVEGTVLNKMIEVQIEKVTEDGQTTLGGATFTVTPSGTSTFVSGVDSIEVVNGSQALYGELIEGNTYHISETVVPNGYTKMEDVTFEVQSDGTVAKISGPHVGAEETDGVITLKAKNTPIQLLFKKQSLKDEVLDGAEFTVTGAFADTSDRTQLVQESIKAVGDSLKGRLVAGEEYTVEETKTPDGYETGKAFKIRVDTLGATITVVEDDTNPLLPTIMKVGNIHTATVKDTPIEVSIQKIGEDADVGGLAGAEFKLEGDNATAFVVSNCEKDSDWNKTENYFAWTTTKNAKTFHAALKAGEVYTLTETKAADGYIYSNPAPQVKFTVKADGTLTFMDETAAAGMGYSIADDKLTLSNQKIALSLTKADIGTNQPITNRGDATFKVTPEAGTFADGKTTEATVTTAEHGMDSLTGQLVAGDTYQVKELTAPNGYQLAGDFTFTVDKQGKIQAISDATIAAGEGGTNLTVYDQTIDVKLRKVSTEDFGNKNTPIMDDSCTFEVTPEADSAFAVAVTDNKVTLNKGNADTGLNGLLIAGNTYKIHEVTAPKGYELMEDVTFTVENDGSVTIDTAAEDHAKVISAKTEDTVEIAVADQPIEVSVQKKDAVGENFLAGAVFKLTDNAGTVLADNIETVGDNGKVTIANTLKGVTFVQGETYTLTETKAPDKFILTDPAPSISFTVETNGTVTFTENGIISGNGTDHITVTNEKTKLYLNKIDNETNERLKGVELQILKGEEIVAEWTSNGADSGLIEGKLVTGTVYTLHEKTPISGYNSMGDITFHLNADNEVVLDSNPEQLVSITVPDEGQQTVNELTIQNVRIRGHVKLQKSVENGKPGDITNVEFDLYRQVGDTPDVTKDERIAERLTTGGDGVWASTSNNTDLFTDIDKIQKTFSKGLTTGNYYFVETKATANTTLDTKTAHPFTIKDSNQGAHGAVVDASSVNRHFGADVSITKLDPNFKAGEAGYQISGVGFSLSYVPEHKTKTDQVTITGTTDARGALTFTDLPKGSYELTETTAEGYDIAGEKAFQATFAIVEADNGTTIVVNETSKDKITKTAGSWNEQGITNPRLLGSVTIHKADGDTTDALKGVEFKLMKQQENVGFIDWLKNLFTGQKYEYVDNVSENLTGSKLDKDGQLTITGLDWGTYKLVETKAKDGYSTADKGKDVAILATTEFTIDRTGLKDIELSVDGHEFYNYQTLLQIRKNGTDGTTGLEGAVFTITGPYVDETGTTVENGSLEARTDTKGQITLKGQLIGGEEYTLHEETAPKGYELITTDMVFTMGTDGTITVVSGEVKEGTEGYRLTQKDFFGNIITAYDTPIEAGLEKAGETDNLLNGAVFEVTPEAGSVFADGSTKVTLTDANKKNGLNKLLIAGNIYRIHEKTAPAGYELAPDVLIKVDANGEISRAEASEKAEVKADKITLRIHDDKVCVTLAKEDADTKQPVGDDTIGYVKLSVTGIFAQPEGTPEAVARTIELASKDSQKLDGLLIAGNTYVVKEMDAPKGYILPNPAPETAILVNADGTLAFVDAEAAEQAGYVIADDKLTLRDEKIALSLTKADISTKQKVIGRGDAVFKVTPKAGTFADGKTTEATVTTAEHGMDSLTGQLVAGDTYQMKELTAPNGYQLAGDFTFTVDKQGKIQAISNGNVAAGGGGTSLTVYDQTIDVKLRKVSTEDFGKENTSIMDNSCTFEVTPGADSDFAVAVSDNRVTLNSQNMDTGLNGMLIAGNTYHVREKVAPMGYELADDFTIKVNEDGSVEVSEGAETFVEIISKDADEVEIEVADQPLSVKFLKRLAGDAVKEGIAGAEFTLSGKLADGTNETTFESQTDAVEIKELLVGGEQYTLTENIAPAGSMAPTEGTKEKFTFTFTIGEDGVVTDVEQAEFEHNTGISYEKETDTITFFNQPTALTIFKKGADTQGGPNDTLLAECTFDVTGVFAPDRYAKTEEKNGLVKSIRNWFGSLGKKEVAEIETIRVTTTGEDGLDNALKGRLIVGETYTVKEITAPNGYQVGGSMTFKVGDATLGKDDSMKLQLEMKDTNGNYDISYDEDGNVNITQRDLPVEFKLRKLNEKKEPLKGAEFAVTGLFEKEETESTRVFISDADGYIDLSKLVSEYNEGAGNYFIYKIVEVTAPEGYQKVEGEIYLRLSSVDQGDGMHMTETEVLYGSNQTPEAFKALLSVTNQNGVEVLNIENTKIPEEPQKPDTTRNGVKTGDTQNILLYVLALLGSIVVALTMIFKRRRRSK